MKIKIVVGLIVAVAIGACIYALAKSSSKKDETTTTRGTDYAPNDTARKDVAVVTSYTDTSDVDMGQIKQDTASSISSRHKMAGNVIKESVSNIFSETDSFQERNTQNKENLNQAFEDLKNL